MNNIIQFLYNLIKGITNSSYGIQCAKIAGIPSNLIERSKHISDCLQNNKQIIPLTNSIDMEKYYDFLIEKFIHLNIDSDDLNEFLSYIDEISTEINNLKLSK